MIQGQGKALGGRSLKVCELIQGIKGDNALEVQRLRPEVGQFHVMVRSQ